MKTQNCAIAFVIAFFMAVTGGTSVHAAGADGTKPDGPVYVDFKNIVVPVIKKNGRSGVVAISMMVQVKDEAAQDKVKSQMPKLRDAFIRTLYGNLEKSRYTRPDGALDIENIRLSLMRTADRVMDGTEQPIQDLLFQNIAQQTF